MVEAYVREVKELAMVQRGVRKESKKTVKFDDGFIPCFLMGLNYLGICTTLA